MYTFNLKKKEKQQKVMTKSQLGYRINSTGKQALSYYIEQNTPLLQDLITNCYPILDELNALIKYFRESLGEKHPYNSETFRNQDDEAKDYDKQATNEKEADVKDYQKQEINKVFAESIKHPPLKNAWLSNDKEIVHPFYRRKKFQQEYNIQEDIRQLNEIVLSELIQRRQAHSLQHLNKLKSKIRIDYQDEAKSRNEDSSQNLKSTHSRPQTLDPKLSAPISDILPSTSLSSHMQNLKAKVRNLTLSCAGGESKRSSRASTVMGSKIQSSPLKQSKTQYKQSYGQKNLSDEDIKRMQRRDNLRLYVRNILGIKRSDDWIYSVNIGNVMHLIPLLFNQFNYHLDNSHELSRDAMLEKVPIDL